MANQAVTLRQLEIGLRRRLAATDTGLFGEFEYPGNKEDEVTNEVWEALNEAQNFVARDIYDPETYPFIRLQHEIPVRDNATVYVLPQDFVSEDQVRHVRKSYSKELIKKQIKDVRGGFDTSRGQSHYLWYDIRGMDNVYTHEGVCTETRQETTELNFLIDAYAAFGDVRVGDRAYNLTDGSEGDITGFTSGNVQTRLFGGRTNIFTRGDRYGIAQPEQNRWVLQVWPPITAGKRLVYRGSAVNIQLDASDILERCRIRFDSLPDDYEDDERITFTLFDPATTEPITGEALSGIQAARVGWNIAIFQQIQLRQNLLFNVTATRENGDALTIAEVEFSAEPDDRIMVDYGRCPRRLITLDSICEFPAEFLSAIYERAKIVLLEKMESDSPLTEFYNRYEYELDKCKENLWTRGQSGGFRVDVDSDGEYIDYVSPGENHWTPYHFKIS